MHFQSFQAPTITDSMQHFAFAPCTQSSTSMPNLAGVWQSNTGTNSVPNTATKCSNKGNKEEGKRKKHDNDVPSFLSKTYHMIDTCDADVACWSDNGDNFVIKDPDAFAAKIIPQYFRHNNFSSFVRQLNFYGFRKIKADPNKLSTLKERRMENKYWRFRHKKFIRGRPDLLVDIRKSTKNSASSSDEVVVLKKEVEALKGQISSMTQDFGKLTSLLQSLLQEKRPVEQDSFSTSAAVMEGGLPARKRKRVEFVLPHVSPVLEPQPTPETQTFATTTGELNPLHSDGDWLLEDPITGAPPQPGSIVCPSQSVSRRQSLCSIGSVDSNFVESLCVDADADADEGRNNEGNNGTQPSVSSVLSIEAPSTKSDANTIHLEPEVIKLQTALSSLPKSTRESLVDRLVSTVTNPDSFQTHVDTVSERLE